MGNSSSKKSSPTCHTRRVRKSKSSNYFGLSEFSLVSFAHTLNSLSFTSGATQQSTYSSTRPWSRVSRHKWRQSTLSNPLEACKTAWPVPHIESAFLPEFKIKKRSEINFEVIGMIAKGAYGRVFKVQKLNNQEYYAMKVLSKAQIISENAIQQVKDEVRIQSMCGHNPFIVNCPYYWQTRKNIYLVSNYMSGGELLALCQQYGALPEQLAAIYIAEIALALDFLHNSGVIFRDLKLENVLLDDLGHAQLIDFGLAKWLPYNSRTHTICGTLQYMAPEILSTESNNGYGHAVDWWSLGVLSCVLLTSKFPPVILKRMAEITAKVQVDSVVKSNNEVKEVSASNVNDSETGLPKSQWQVEVNECAKEFIPSASSYVKRSDDAHFLLGEPGCDSDKDNDRLIVSYNSNSRDELDRESIQAVYEHSAGRSVSDASGMNFIRSESLQNDCYENGSKRDMGVEGKSEKQANELRSIAGEKELSDQTVNNVLRTHSKKEGGSQFGCDVECSVGGKDLIQRLLQADPQKRLRSLLTLQTIRFFKDFSFADVRTKKVAPKDILRQYFPYGPVIYEERYNLNETFLDFSSDFI